MNFKRRLQETNAIKIVIAVEQYTFSLKDAFLMLIIYLIF